MKLAKLHKLRTPEASTKVAVLLIVVIFLFTGIASIGFFSGNVRVANAVQNPVGSPVSSANFTHPEQSASPSLIRNMGGSLVTGGSLAPSSVNSYYAGATTGLLSSQNALQASIYVFGCECSNSQDYVGSWVAYYVNLSNGTEFWVQFGFQALYGQTSANDFEQIWNINTGHWGRNPWVGGSQSFGSTVSYKITTYLPSSSCFYFSHGNSIYHQDCFSNGITITGMHTGGSNNQALYEQDGSSSWGIISTEKLTSMTSYLCNSSGGNCNWASWGNGQAYNTAYLTLAGHNQYSTIPTDQAWINYGIYTTTSGYLW
jgi:hypothetical protein